MRENEIERIYLLFCTSIKIGDQPMAFLHRTDVPHERLWLEWSELHATATAGGDSQVQGVLNMGIFNTVRL